MKILMLALSLTAFNGEGARFVQTEESVKTATYGHIDARGLKALLDSKTPLLLLDARGNKWNENAMIPGTQFASYEFSQAELEKLAPDRNQLIVVYCFSFNCPLSRRLTAKLVELGYKNVIEYPGGLKEWRDVAEYPATPIVQ